ncbi:hypothetical protein ACLQ3C_12295 [Gordonia sp. DT30]|uniref:hypothetical protein n=1 Tax=unclassified Gordonia (in: high G+C Gram-positive bacteria) TaxID=2657482 RepID=UPI003CF50588
MTLPGTDDQQHADEDHAADLRDRGRSWAEIADDLGITTASAKKYAAAADHRAAERCARNQISLF